MENLIFNKDYFFHEKSLDKSFCFSKDHVSSRENNFKYVGSKLKPNANILELGTFEGKSALYFFYNFLSKEGSITTVDYKINDNLKQNLKLLADETNFVFIKANFLKLIPNLLSENKKFDLVYIDGGKDSKMTIFQIVNVWEMLPIGGIMFMDDYTWRKKSSNEFLKNIRKFFRKILRKIGLLNFPLFNLPGNEPYIAINSFLKIYRGYYEVLFKNGQVAIIKIKN